MINTAANDNPRGRLIVVFGAARFFFNTAIALAAPGSPPTQD
jgi:hypothetical protein